MITIVDYQMGNLRSVQKAFEKNGHQAQITSDPEVVGGAEKLVLPGVGAFADCMSELRTRGLVEPICEVVRRGAPFLGICLGLQVLFDVGYEDGTYEGMGLIPGKVVRFSIPRGYKVPHMGWNTLEVSRRPPILQGVPEGSHFYFDHSYHVEPTCREVIAATTPYPDPFCSVIWKDNVFATQFHPEKSQQFGLKLLDNFARL